MFLFPFNFFLFSVQNEFVVRSNTLSPILHGETVIEIASMLHVKLDLDVLIRFYISRFKFRWIGSDLQRSGAAWSGAWASPSRLALRARSARSRLARARSFCQKYMNSYMITAKNIWIHTWYEIIFVWIHKFKVQKIYKFIHGAPQITYEDPILSH